MANPDGAIATWHYKVDVETRNNHVRGANTNVPGAHYCVLGLQNTRKKGTGGKDTSGNLHIQRPPPKWIRTGPTGFRCTDAEMEIQELPPVGQPVGGNSGPDIRRLLPVSKRGGEVRGQMDPHSTIQRRAGPG